MNIITQDGVPSLVVEFDDTQFLVPLFGAHDCHLARIEQRLGLSLVPRGNRVAILGNTSEAEIARMALEDLYLRLKNGLEISEVDVDGAIRMAESKPLPERNTGDKKKKSQRNNRGKHDKNRPSVAIINTQKKAITPHSPTQAAYVQAMRRHDLVF